MTTFCTVWTPTKTGDFVTKLAIDNGGDIIKEFNRQVDAVIFANKMNKETKGMSGNYSVLIR